MPLAIKHTGRTKQFCSDRCRKEVTRHPQQKAAGALFQPPPYPSEALSGNPQKTSTKTTAKTAISADRGSAFTPVWRVVAGPPVSLANLVVPLDGVVQPKPISPDERAELIRRAIALEFAARWPRGGV
jgi:hypothetical protein